MTAPSAARTTRIKICGVRSIETARIAVEAGADAIGMVIDVPGSPRTLSLAEALEIQATLPPIVMSVAVMTNPDPSLAERWRGSWIQLHGDEDEALVAQVGRTKHVVKGFRFDAQQVRRWNSCPDVDVLLVDGSAGGEGVGFRHEELAALMPGIEKPVILAGGLTAENVGAAIRTVRPFAVDVSSGVETEPGVKDPELIRAFCDAVAGVE